MNIDKSTNYIKFFNYFVNISSGRLDSINDLMENFGFTQAEVRGLLKKLNQFSLTYAKNRSGIFINKEVVALLISSELVIKKRLYKNMILFENDDIVISMAFDIFILAAEFIGFEWYDVISVEMILTILVHLSEKYSIVSTKTYKINKDGKYIDTKIRMVMQTTKRQIIVIKRKDKVNKVEYII